MTVAPKTFEEHCEYMKKTIQLEMFYAFLHHRKFPEEPLRDILQNRVSVVRFTTHFRPGMDDYAIFKDDKGYQELEGGLADLLKKHENDPDSLAFEEVAYQYLKPEFDANAHQHYEDSMKLATVQRCGFLRYDLHPYKDYPGWMAFHISNDCAPNSFLDYPEHIKESFAGILDAAENEMKVDTIFCCSWLNSFPKWLALFPEEWTANRGPERDSICWHFGFWGQFINSRGLFNDRYGEIFRKTGKMPYAFRPAHCSVKAMREKYGL